MTNQHIVIDTQAREDIVHKTDRSFFVEAGAGSGKTHQLVERLITLIIEDGVSIEHIAAITFTEAAAAELTARLRKSLATIQLTGELPNGFTDPRTFTNIEQAKERAGKAMEGLPGAAIETLHSFCLRLLKRYPFEAGLPPKVEKSDELLATYSSVSAGDVTLQFFDAILEEDPDAEALLAELNCGTSAEKLRDSLTRLLDNEVKITAIAEIADWMDQNWGDLHDSVILPISVKKLTKQTLTSLREDLAKHNHQGYGKSSNEFVASYVAPLIEEMDRVIAATTGDEISSWTFTSGANYRRGGRGAADKAMKDCLRATEDEIKALLKAPTAEASAYVRRVMAALIIRNARERVRTGRIEFHDMIFLASDLVAKNENVREALHQHYQAIFVDEFQDTDPIQLQIVTDIARGAGDKPVEGRLFTVGDPKQSIYKFRRADIESYMGAKTTMNALADERGLEGSAERTMHRNFRSSPAVVHWVNQVFGDLFEQTSSDSGPRQATYEGMIPNESEYAGKVVLLRDMEALEGEDTDLELKPKDLENLDIIDLIKVAVNNAQGGYCHHAVPRAGEPFTLEDIAILAPTHSVAARIMAALDDVNIPYVSEGSLSLFAAEEIMDLLVILRAISDPADGFSQVAALRTLTLGISDQQLAAHFAQEEKVEEVQEKISWLNDKRDESTKLPLGHFVRSIAEELHLRENIASAGRIMDLSRLDAFLIHADAYGKTSGLGLREFANWAQEQSLNKQGFSDPILDNSIPGVRILTVHKSKGREFPMVIMAGMTAYANNAVERRGFLQSPPVPGKPEGYNVASFKFAKDIAAPGFDEFAQIDKAADENEATRLHYVAATRAKSTLAIPFECKTGKKDNPRKADKRQSAAAFYNVVRGDNPDEHPFMSLEKLAAPTEHNFLVSGLKEVSPDLSESLAQNQELLERASLVAPRIAVTTIAHALDHSSADLAEEKDATVKKEETSRSAAALATGAKLRENMEALPLPAGYEKGIKGNVDLAGGTAFGSAVHEVMELLTAEGDIEALTATVAPLHGIGLAQQSDVVKAAESLRNTDAFGRILASSEVMREVPLIADIDGVAVDGVIDVLYRDGDEWVIADYKTDRFTKATMIQSYLTQLDLYAGIVEKALGKKIARLELIFVGKERGTVVQHSR